jgi:hypothetical protein
MLRRGISIRLMTGRKAASIGSRRWRPTWCAGAPLPSWQWRHDQHSRRQSWDHYGSDFICVGRGSGSGWFRASIDSAVTSLASPSNPVRWIACRCPLRQPRENAVDVDRVAHRAGGQLYPQGLRSGLHRQKIDAAACAGIGPSFPTVARKPHVDSIASPVRCHRRSKVVRQLNYLPCRARERGIPSCLALILTPVSFRPRGRLPPWGFLRPVTRFAGPQPTLKTFSDATTSGRTKGKARTPLRSPGR